MRRQRPRGRRAAHGAGGLFSAPPLALGAVYPPTRHLSVKVRLFIDFLVERFGRARMRQVAGADVSEGLGREAMNLPSCGARRVHWPQHRPPPARSLRDEPRRSELPVSQSGDYAPEVVGRLRFYSSVQHVTCNSRNALPELTGRSPATSKDHEDCACTESPRALAGYDYTVAET